MDGSALVVPVGHSIGTRHDDLPAGSTHCHQVRVGAEILEPTDLEFRLWSLAHGMGERMDDSDSRRPWTRDVLIEEAASGTGDRAQVERAVDSLYRQQLLDEVNPAAPEATRFAERYRLLPLALGLGTRAEDGLTGVGLLNFPAVLLAPALADLWQWSPMSPNLWDACRQSAEVAKAAKLDDAEQTDPERVLSGVLGSLHVLLAGAVACVDLCVGTERERTR